MRGCTKRRRSGMGTLLIRELVSHIILGFALYKVLFYVFHQWYWEYYNEKMREMLHIAMHS